MNNIKSKVNWENVVIVIVIFVGIIFLFAYLSIPKFIHPEDKARITATTQSLGALRKAMEMYLADENTYPLELGNSDSINSSNLKLISSLGRYTNVTNLLKSFENEEIKSISITKKYFNKYFTIIAKAKDREFSLITATADNIFKP